MFEKSEKMAIQFGGRIALPAHEVEVLCRIRDYASYSGMGNTHMHKLYSSGQVSIGIDDIR